VAAMATPQPNWKDRAYDLHKRQHPVLRKVIVAVIGFVLIAIGAALLVLPGPGILVILAGIAVLSLEFPWAKALFDRIRAAVDAVLRKLGLRK
jgi:uncharacterized protein (TIGR02611 family)